MIIKGRVKSGCGKASVSQKGSSDFQQRMHGLLGWLPVFGTLNIRTTQAVHPGRLPNRIETGDEMVLVHGFLLGAPVALYRAAGSRQHPKTIELLSPFHLRRYLDLVDGQAVELKLT